MKRSLEEFEEIERSILKTFRKRIWRPFTLAIKDYELIRAGDRIMVCISGGKDSILLAKCLQELARHSAIPFEARYVVMDPGYNEENRQSLIQNAQRLHIPIEIFDTPIFDVVAEADESPCYLCARMRRGYLYGHAKEIGCNKIALGHHFDDVVETVLLSMFWGAEVKTMLPKLHSDNYPGLELIRPLYKVREADIIAWRDHWNLRFLKCACRFTESCSLGDDGMGSKRGEIKALIKEMKRQNSQVDLNIFNAIHNVNRDAIVGWHSHRKKHTFLEDYEVEM